ncbi:MAG: hypothetical protein KC656_15775, partial [Myxococcales bacterium]|nr:hypothetical protein [Myxococcales bacterium]
MIGLHEAVRSARPLQGEVIVVKAGGELLEKASWLDALAADVAVLARLGVRVVVVHGGGPQLDRRAASLGLETRRVAGRRVTDPALIEAAVMEWRGRLSSLWVRALHRHGERAIGLAGFDGELVRAVRR